jgi:hypothetical protein
LEIDNKKLKTDLAYSIKTDEKLLGQLKDTRFVEKDEFKEKERIEEVLGVSGSLALLRKRVDNSEAR